MRIASMVLALFICGSAEAQNMALQVDGSNTALKVPQNASLEPSQAMTVECWVKALGSVAHGRVLRKENGKGYSLCWSFQGKPVSGQFYCGGTTFGAYDTVPSATLLGTWHHIAMTCTLQGKVRYFRDGVLIAEAPGPSCMNHSGDLFIGNGPVLTEGFIGSIDEVRIWNVERTPEQIQSSYLLQFDQAPGLVAMWHLDGDGIDVVGGNNGTPLGNAFFVPSDAPFGFSFTPLRGDWQGGSEATLSGSFSQLGIGSTPHVFFGEHEASNVRVVDATTLIATVPPASHPGEVVSLSVEGSGITMNGEDTFTYTPRLSATATVPVGGSLDVLLEMDPPSVTGFFLGLKLPATGAASPLGWHLECAPILRVFLANAPFQDQLGFRMKVPDQPGLESGEIVVQAVVQNAATKGGTFSNGAVIEIVAPGP